MFWRKPVTHAAALWVLVGAAAGALIATLAYMAMLSGIREGVVEVRPPKDAAGAAARQLPPTLFGTVAAFDGTVVEVDSKQPFDEVVIESDTTVTTVGGSAVPTSSIVPGAKITAAGIDLGDGRLSAIAIVILEAR